MEVGIKSQEGKRKMSEDEVFGVSWLPLMRAVWGLRWRGEHRRRNPKPRPRVAVPCRFLEEAQSSFFIALPRWRAACHPGNTPFPLPVVQGAELSHQPSLTSQKYKANEMGVRMCSVSERCVALECEAASWPRPHPLSSRPGVALVFHPGQSAVDTLAC